MSVQYWDTSAVVKLFVPEDDSAWFLGEARVAGEIVTSALAATELFCVLRRKEEDGWITGGSAVALYQQFEKDLSHNMIRLIAYDREVIDEGVRLTTKLYGGRDRLLLRSLDAVHLASALVAKTNTMIATDRRLREAALAVGIRVKPQAADR